MQHLSTRRVLVIEAISAGAAVTRTAHALGIPVVLFSHDAGDRKVPDDLRELVDTLIVVDTNDRAALERAAKELHARTPVSAVLPGCDVYVPAAARVAAALGLPGLAADTVDEVRDKALMRARTAAAGLLAPRHVEVTSADGLAEAAAVTGFPCVLKPVDESGSIHVSRADDQAALAAAYDRLVTDPRLDLGRPLSGRALVEEYVSGDEYSVDGYVRDGDVHVLAVTRKLLGPEPYFVETGHLTPARLEPSVAEETHAYVRRVAEAVHLTTGPFHCELRLTPRGPVLIEIGARLPGDYITELVELTTGVDLSKVALATALGVHPDELGARGPARVPSAGVRFFTAPPGTHHYRELTGWQELGRRTEVLRTALAIRPGEPIPEPGDFRCRIGHALFTAGSPAEVEDTWQALGAAVTVV
ncbi:ATP-grasp domain-containing protein [Streptomyces flavidovirens]|uniref:ATP-grasp domain-containing protein n=1 Tax=Streptomyces flavidovirens TaxID=67298 RepID=UPI00341281BB